MAEEICPDCGGAHSVEHVSIDPAIIGCSGIGALLPLLIDGTLTPETLRRIGQRMVERIPMMIETMINNVGTLASAVVQIGHDTGSKPDPD